MSRAKTAHLMSMVITQAVRLAFPDSRAKRIARALGCSFMTGRRIAETGRASDRWELVSLLRQELARNRAAIDEIDRKLGEISYAEALPAVGSRAAPAMGEIDSAIPGLADGAGDSRTVGGKRT